MRIANRRVISSIYFIFSVISFVLISMLYIVNATLSLTSIETVTIWGTSVIYDLPVNYANFDYEFGPGNFGAIKPLFIIGLVLIFIFSNFLRPPGKNNSFFSKKNFLSLRIIRSLLIVGGICGFTSLMLFAKFINQLNMVTSVYRLNVLFYLGVITFVLAIILGLLGALSEIKGMPSKSKEEALLESSDEQIDDENIQKDSNIKEQEIQETDLSK